MEQRRREKEAYDILNEKKLEVWEKRTKAQKEMANLEEELEQCKRHAYETRHGGNTTRRPWSSQTRNYPASANFNGNSHRGNAHRGHVNRGGSGRGGPYRGGPTPHHHRSTSSLQGQQQQQESRFRSRSPARGYQRGPQQQRHSSERGRFSRHEHHQDQGQYNQQQRHASPQQQQQQQREDGQSMVREMREFIAEIRDALGTRRQEDQRPGEH